MGVPFGGAGGDCAKRGLRLLTAKTQADQARIRLRQDRGRDASGDGAWLKEKRTRKKLTTEHPFDRLLEMLTHRMRCAFRLVLLDRVEHGPMFLLHEALPLDRFD